MTKTIIDPDRDLVLTRRFEAPPAKVFRAWTDPELMKQWFAPKPWTTPHVEIDLRPGGSSLVVMRSPEGEDYPNPGIYLDVVPNRRLVSTDAYTDAWTPSQKPFMTLILTFDDDNGGTTYTALARHWSAEDCQAHVKMGFHEGWGQCADQLADLLKSF